MDAVKRRMALRRDRAVVFQWRIGIMSEDVDQLKLHETESKAPRVERAQEGQDADTTAMHARYDGECSESQPVELCSLMEDVLVLGDVWNGESQVFGRRKQIT